MVGNLSTVINHFSVNRVVQFSLIWTKDNIVDFLALSVNLFALTQSKILSSSLLIDGFFKRFQISVSIQQVRVTSEEIE